MILKVELNIWYALLNDFHNLTNSKSVTAVNVILTMFLLVQMDFVKYAG